MIYKQSKCNYCQIVELYVLCFVMESLDTEMPISHLAQMYFFPFLKNIVNNFELMPISADIFYDPLIPYKLCFFVIHKLHICPYAVNEVVRNGKGKLKIFSLG